MVHTRKDGYPLAPVATALTVYSRRSLAFIGSATVPESRSRGGQD